MRKYKLTDETRTLNGTILYRIEALRDFNDVKAGDKGGFVKSEENLSHRGTCWVYDNAIATGCTLVMDDATMHDYAIATDCTLVMDDATMHDYASLRGHSSMWEHSEMWDDSSLHGHASIRQHASLHDYEMLRGQEVRSKGKAWRS